MADPLSVASGIGGLVTLTDLVFSRIFKYVQAVKGASKEIAALSSEVGALYGVLSSLQLVAQQLDPRTISATTLRAHHINSCTQTLEKMRKILDKDSTSSLQTQTLESVKRKLHWPFSSSEVKSLLAECERHKATLGLALKADSMTGLVQLLSNQEDFRDTLNKIKTDLDQRHEADTRIAMDSKRQSILKSFGTTNPSRNQKMGLKLRQPGTGLWLIESPEYLHWAQTENSKLWLQGIPGAGKTVLAATVIEDVLRTSNSNHAVAFFYCDYKDPATHEPRLLLGSLVQQIAKQDEQSFERVKSFCDTHNPEYKENVEYDPQELLELVCDLTISFDRATIMVDGLDECGVNAAAVTELLASLNRAGKETNIKTLFLSRNHVDIREYLDEYTEIAIAAKSSDLRLYVGAEIDARTRNHKLRIKEKSLKEHIMERLVEGADGMFRWVACQMDYLCELPNDSSRRKALQNLPPTLPATYERILRSVNTRPKETQLLVSRTLRWIVHCQTETMTTQALCEAVSINIGDTKRDKDSIPDELEVLRWCSSLVRKGVDRECLELAHFSVKEFLLQLDDDDMGEFAVYRVGPNHDEIDLAKVCLTYLNFCDFDQEVRIDKEVTERRLEDCPLREYSVYHWYNLAGPRLADDVLLLLAKKLLKPSKTGTLLSWLHDWIFLRTDPEEFLDKIDGAIAEATVLHFASMLSLPEVCRWLIDSVGCDLNKNSKFGTPLHCSLLAMDTLINVENYGEKDWLPFLAGETSEEQNRVVEILLGAGADPNRHHRGVSPLLMTLQLWDAPNAALLIDNGARLDEHCLQQLERVFEAFVQEDRLLEEDFQRIISHVRSRTVEAKDCTNLLKMTMKFRSLGAATRILGTDRIEDFENADFESALRAAAEFGQIDVIDQMLREQPTAIEAAEGGMGLTALHYAARNDHLDVVKLIVNKGADPFNADSNGRTAVHHATCSNGVLCLDYFLGNRFADILPDKEGLSLWHLAALAQTKQTLETLAKYFIPMPLLSDVRAKDGRSPLLCAASVGCAENIEWLLLAGCTTMESAYDGSTALHLAARSGSSKAVQALLTTGSEVNAATEDGSTALHFALVEITKEVGIILDALFEHEIDASAARKDGTMAIDILIIHYNSILTLTSYYPHLFEALLAAFRAFLAGTNDLTGRNWGGFSSLQLIADSWLKSSLHPSWLNRTWAHDTAIEIILIAMAQVPLAKSSHNPFTNPNLTISALTIHDEELVRKFLRFSPDVDAPIKDTSIIKAACFYGCSSILLQDLLSRSKLQRENMQVNGIIRAACVPAAKKSSEEIVRTLMEAGLSPNDSCPVSGETALMVAALHGNTDVMKVLLSYGADVHASHRCGTNVAHSACLGACIEAVKILQTTTVDLDRRGSIGIQSQTFNGAHILHVAAAGSSTLLEFLLEENLVTDINVTSERSNTALFIAAWADCPSNVSFLLSKNADAAIRSLASETPLHVATRVGNEAVVSVFLQHKCDINILDGGGLDCETLAKRNVPASFGHLPPPITARDLIELQIKDLLSTASPEKSPLPIRLSTATPLILAAYRGHAKIARLLLEYGASPHTTDNSYRNALHFATEKNRPAVVELLLDYGANVHAVNDSLETPSMIAAAYDSWAALQVLKARGADFGSRDCDGRTILHHTSSSESVSLVPLLAMAGDEDLGQEDIWGTSPISRVLYWGGWHKILSLINYAPKLGAYCPRLGNILTRAILNPEMTTSLLKKLLRRLSPPIVATLLEHRDLYDGTPLYAASTTASLPFQQDNINLLLEAGADIEQVGGQHGTPLMGACAAGRLAVVKFLISKGAKLCYEGDDRTIISALHAAKYFPETKRWILVERFTHGPKRILNGVNE
ncbi:MAG: hypothetical protein Q9226_003563 [Calogaya cf. arnoldii]